VEVEYCREQLVAGTNFWMTFKMDDNTFTKAKFFQSLSSDDYSIECVWQNQEANADYEYSC